MTAIVSRVSRSEWFRRVEEWEKSGQTKVAYCRQHQYSLTNFYHWSGEYRQTQEDSSLETSTGLQNSVFVPVAFSSDTAEMTLTCGYVSLRFSGRVRADQLVPWIRALRAGVCSH